MSTICEQTQPLLAIDEDFSHRTTGFSYLDWSKQPLANHHHQLMNKVAALTHPAHLATLARRLGYALLPQIIRSELFDDPAPKGKEFSTSYLNGLRGITAIKVFTFHYVMVYTDAPYAPYATDDRHTYFLERPIIRYFYAGFTSHIFFCLAGYLTSLRLFQLLDKNDANSQAKVLLSISGSLFRRAFRLYLPVFLVSLCTATYIYWGFYEANRPLLEDKGRLFPGEWREPRPPMYPTYREQLGAWADEMYQLSNFVSPATLYPLHDQHLWSILAEMRASLHLYGCLLALAQVKRNLRLIGLFVLVGVYLYWNHWEIWVYILGAIVAHIDLVLTERQKSEENPPNLPMTEKSHLHYMSDSLVSLAQLSPWPISSTSLSSPAVRRPLKRFGRYLAFFITFWLLSYPIFGWRDYAPGYETLNLYIPEWMERKDKFYANWGTFFLLLLLVRSNPTTSRVRRLCSHWLPQYFGKISFALYLLQAHMMHGFGYLVPHKIWWSFGTEGREVGDKGWLSAIVIGWAITLIVTLWAADVWTREVEGRCIKFVKWLEKACFR